MSITMKSSPCACIFVKLRVIRCSVPINYSSLTLTQLILRHTPNDALDVVALRLCVNGGTGLRVVDYSVIPTLVPGNTHAAAVMLAEKAADMVRAGGQLAH